MKNALLDDCPAGTVTVMLVLPATVPLAANTTLLGSELVSVTTKPPAGAAAPSDNDGCTCKSLPIVCAPIVIAGAVTVAVIWCCEACGVLKPVGTPMVICAVPADKGWNAVSCKLSPALNTTGLVVIDPTLVPVTSATVTGTLTAAIPPRSACAACTTPVPLSRADCTRNSVFAENVVVVKLPPGLLL